MVTMVNFFVSKEIFQRWDKDSTFAKEGPAETKVLYTGVLQLQTGQKSKRGKGAEKKELLATVVVIEEENEQDLIDSPFSF